MDYKARFPHIDYWAKEVTSTMHMPFPYDSPTEAFLLQIEAPDQSTQFLCLPPSFTPDERFMVTYLIEASVDCPMRREFEFGELTWLEFWHHRGWLIEMKYEFQNAGGGYVRYVHPSQMSSAHQSCIKRQNHKSPMQLKLEALEECFAYPRPFYHLKSAYAAQIEDFRRKYPEILSSLPRKTQAA